MYQESSSASNGSGEEFFIGRNADNSIRRALVAFDIAGNIPAGSQIDSVALVVNMDRTIAGGHPATLHRLLADWGEGASVASSSPGDGTTAQTGDATWTFAFFNSVQWTTSGGVFVTSVSDQITIGGLGLYTWTGSGLVTDVQFWLDNPSSNFGWIMRGDEGQDTTAKRFDSREGTVPPVLHIEYSMIAPTERQTWGRIKALYNN